MYAGPLDRDRMARSRSPLEEDAGEYRKGGYHRVSVGESFNGGVYIVRSKLGWGRFSTVWLAWDTLHSRCVALKVQKSSRFYTEAATEEIKILQQIADGDPEDIKCVVKLLDHFKHSGPNGDHVCMVFELLGDNLCTLIKYTNYQGIPLPMVKEICCHVLMGLDYLHRDLNIIHTDLKPENILLTSTIDPAKRSVNEKGKQAATSESASSPREMAMEVETQCKVVDFGNACWVHTHFTDNIQAAPYRCPEVLLGLKYSTPADMWSFACICFELATGEELFVPHKEEGFDMGFDMEDDHLAQMIERLGAMPHEIVLTAPYSRQFFNKDGSLRNVGEVRYWPLQNVLVEKYKLGEKEASGLAGFLLPILNIIPDKRPSAAELLLHPWLNMKKLPIIPDDDGDSKGKRPEKEKDNEGSGDVAIGELQNPQINDLG